MQLPCLPLDQFTAEVPDGAIVGLTGEESPDSPPSRGSPPDSCSLSPALSRPRSRDATSDPPIPLTSSLPLPSSSTRALSLQDDPNRARSRLRLERLRRSGSSILLLSHEQDLLRDLCDEIWWLRDGTLAGRGDPRQVLAAYNAHIALRLREWASAVSQPLDPSMRRGDGRARLLAIEPLDGAGAPTLVWSSGEPGAVRVTVRFEQPVDDPVVGIMIRTPSVSRCMALTPN